MEDATLLALCVWSEAAGESVAGKQAVAQVVLNRMRLHYMSDGTVPGTVLYPNQFSGFYFDMRDGRYTRVCWTSEDAEHRAEQMLLGALHQAVWDICLDVGTQALEGDMDTAPALANAVLYLNPAILSKLPAWAAPEKQLCIVGHHTFYRA